MSLHELQTRVHVAKDKRAGHGNFSYRTAEGILSAAKAALPDGASIVITDDIKEMAGQIFLVSTATVTFSDGTSASATGLALHALTKKGMDPSQLTGAASSYARKYALGGLLALDDGSVDPDGAKDVYEAEEKPKPPTPAESRDRIKAAIARATDAQTLDRLWNHDVTKKTFAGLPAPMQGELTKAHSDRMAEVFQAPAAEGEQNRAQYQ